jgi:hypothetical protein
MAAKVYGEIKLLPDGSQGQRETEMRREHDYYSKTHPQ